MAAATASASSINKVRIEDTLVSDNDQILEENFVEHVKDLGVHTKDALLHTVANFQHALEIAGDYIRTQLSSIPSENTKMD